MQPYTVSRAAGGPAERRANMHWIKFEEPLTCAKCGDQFTAGFKPLRGRHIWDRDRKCLEGRKVYEDALARETDQPSAKPEQKAVKNRVKKTSPVRTRKTEPKPVDPKAEAKRIRTREGVPAAA